FQKARSFDADRGSFRNGKRDDNQRGNSRDSQKFDRKPAPQNGEGRGDFKRFERKPSDRHWEDRGASQRFDRKPSDRRFEQSSDFKPRGQRFERNGDDRERRPDDSREQGAWKPRDWSQSTGRKRRRG
ncbi:MAG TPA: hypothetical protein DDY54_06155, partial [Deltaproteobacteria bacterium]|nr:hypothetical protein [Deltaproteobacteria bacterium]